MFREERRNRLLETLLKKGEIRVPEVARQFKVSESTIRLDLKELDSRGLILRTHGGAIASNSQVEKPIFEVQKTFPERLTENSSAKRSIGRAVAQLIKAGETIMIDGGSTTREVCFNLGSHQNLILVTNVVNTYPDLIGYDSDIRVVMTGGELIRESMTLVGEEAQLTVARYRASKAILGIDAISVAFGITTLDSRAAALKKCMIEYSNKLIVVADSSKINKVSLAPVVPLERVDVLVTDDKINPTARSEVEALGVEVVVAPNEAK